MQVEVEVAHDQLLVAVAGDVADELAPGVDEVARAVEVVVAVLLDADPVDGGDEVLVGDGGRGLLELPQVGGQAPAGGGGVVDDLGAGQAEGAPALGEVAVVADVDADPADGGVEHRPAEVARAEVVLLPEALDLRDVVLAVLAEVGAVGVDDRRGVVVEAGLLDLVDRHHEHHAGLRGQRLHALHGGAVGHRLGPAVVLGVLHLAEVGAVEHLLEAHDLGALGGGVAGVLLVGVDHRLLVAGPLRLEQRGPHDVCHRTGPLSCGRTHDPAPSPPGPGVPRPGGNPLASRAGQLAVLPPSGIRASPQEVVSRE